MTLLRGFAAALETIRTETYARQVRFQAQPNTTDTYGCMVTNCDEIQTIDCRLCVGANEIILRVCSEHAQQMSDDFSKELSR